MTESIVQDLIRDNELLRKENKELRGLLLQVQKEVSRYRRENDYLKEKIVELENTLRWRNIEVKQDLEKIVANMNRVRGQILRAILELTQRNGSPPHYDDITRYIKNRNPHVSVETITRACRKMKEEGILFSPARGKYYLKPDKIKEIEEKGINRFLKGDG